MKSANFRKLVGQHPSVRAAGTYLLYPREARARFLLPRERDTTGAALFTTQKCASTFLAKALRRIGKHYRKTIYDFAGLYWGKGEIDVYHAIERDASRLFVQPHAIYGPLRRYIDLPDLDRRPLVLMLRDPRDVLVSSYYSVAYSHALPGGAAARAKFEARRTAARAMDIDEFVRDAAEPLQRVYRAYADHLLHRPNLTLLTYEELIANPREWSRRLIRAIGLEPDEVAVQQLCTIYEQGKPRAGENRINEHRRSGEAEQFRKHLKPETIEFLQNLFDEEWRRFACWGG
jgi:hypothetical protein